MWRSHRSERRRVGRATPARSTRISVRWLLLCSYAVLGVSWVFSDPPFSGPDEAAHFLRAVGISNGALIGPPAPGPLIGLDPLQQQTIDATTRAVTVPAGLSPDDYWCEVDDPYLSAACLLHPTSNANSIRDASYVGTYEPLPYLPAALALRAALVVDATHHAPSALRLTRLAMLAAWLALLAVAIWMLWDASVGAPSLIGLILAVTPMVVFLGATVTDSSAEIMASLAFFATLLRIGRDGGRGASQRLWLLAGACGLVLALSRPLGPAWVVLDLLVWSVFVGPRVAWRALQRGGSAMLMSATVVFAAIAANRYWETTYEPRTTLTLLPSWSNVSIALTQFHRALSDLVGNFGYLTNPLSPIAVWAWALAAALLAAVAIAVGDLAARVALIGGLVIAFVFPVYFVAASYIYTGFGLQGRHFLPFVVVLPLAAAETLRRRSHRLAAARPRQLLGLVAVLAGVVQFAAWWTNAHRYAVGIGGPTWFLPVAQWSPPGDWVLWMLLAGAASLALALCWLRPPDTELGPLTQS